MNKKRYDKVNTENVKIDKIMPVAHEEMEWLLRYGSEEQIIENRMYIASIVKEYGMLIQKG